MPPGTPKRSPSGQTNQRGAAAISATGRPRRKRCSACASHWTWRSPPGVARVTARSPARAKAALSVCGSTSPGRGLAAGRSARVDSAVPTRLPNAMPVSPATQPEPNCVPARLMTTAAEVPSASEATLTAVPPSPTTQRSTRRRSVSGAADSAKADEVGAASSATVARRSAVMPAWLGQPGRWTTRSPKSIRTAGSTAGVHGGEIARRASAAPSRRAAASISAAERPSIELIRPFAGDPSQRHGERPALHRVPLDRGPRPVEDPLDRLSMTAPGSLGKGPRHPARHLVPSGGGDGGLEEPAPAQPARGLPGRVRTGQRTRHHRSPWT